MSDSEYENRALKISLIIDIAIEVFKKCPPKDFSRANQEQFIKVYSEFKTDALNPLAKFHNLKSLSYIENDVLIYFREGTGEPVSQFWNQIKKKEIFVERKPDVLTKVLKRGRLKDDIERDTIIDNYLHYREIYALSEEQWCKIDQMIDGA